MGRHKTPARLAVVRAVKYLLLNDLATACARVQVGLSDQGKRPLTRVEGPTAPWGIVPLLGPLWREDRYRAQQDGRSPCPRYLPATVCARAARARYRLTDGTT